MSIFSRHSRITAVAIGAATALGVGGTVIGVNAANAPATPTVSSAATTPTTPGGSSSTPTARTRRAELGRVDAISSTSLTLTISSGQSVTLPLSSSSRYRGVSGALEAQSAIHTGELVRVVLVRGDSFSSSGSANGSATVQRVRDLGFQVTSN